MQVTETLNEGLKREIKIVVPKEDMVSQLDEKLETLKGQVKLNGFRQGKVPKSHLQQMYGKSAMAEIVNDYVSKRTGEILQEREERAAQQPEINMTEDEKEADEILAGKKDFEFSMVYEVIPEINVPELEKLKLTRPVAEVSDKEVDEQIEKIGDNMKPYEEKKGKAADGDRVIMNYLGKIDGEPFDGGADNDAQLVIGSGQFIPGFEEQLTGVKTGDEKTIKVTFPEDYPAENLKGKEAEFDVSVKAVKVETETKVDDDFATSLGLDSLDKLKELLRGQLEQQTAGLTRTQMKRALLDQLAAGHDFDVPGSMVDAEFEQIWNQIHLLNPSTEHIIPGGDYITGLWCVGRVSTDKPACNDLTG